MPTSDVHQRVTAHILAGLATADPATWCPPWHGAGPRPTNALTGKRYRGLNVLTLWLAAQAAGFSDHRWATYRQWAALHGQVRKGEKGTLVLCFKDLGPAEIERLASTSSGDYPGPRFVARASYVFNAAQVDGVEAEAAPLPNDFNHDPIPAFDAFVTATKATIVPGPSACYIPSRDLIRLPPRNAFISAEAYAATLSHELVHWSGASHRLARDLRARFHSSAYAAEELIAEIGAAFVMADLGIARTPHPNHAAYLSSWLPLLKDDPRALGIAASKATHAAEYLITLGDTQAPHFHSLLLKRVSTPPPQRRQSYRILRALAIYSPSSSLQQYSSPQ